MDTELNPAAGEWAVFPEGPHRAQPLWQRGRRGGPGRVHRWSRSLLHHWREPDGRRRHESL